MSWKIIDYTYVEELNPEIIVLQMQKIYDFTSPNLIENAYDQNQMGQTFLFYSDAKNKDLDNYVLYLGDDYGMVFLRSDISELFSCPVEQQ